LRNSNINDQKLELLSGVEFKNLEELNLSHNKIINILPLKNFKTIKKLDISFNKIYDIKPLKEISENNKIIKEINLSNNEIKDVEILKQDIFPCISKINLENNKNLIQKDIDEIISIVKKRKKLYTDRKDDFRNYYEILKEIKREEFKVIYKAKDKKSGELRAIKILEKYKIINSLIRCYKNSFRNKEENTYIEPYIEGWLDEINNMKILDNNNNSEYLVKIYDYFNNENELVIVMELCDENLNDLLKRRKSGFKPNEIKQIFTLLNNVFKIDSYKKLFYEELSIENIFIKYLDVNKSKYLVKFKFSDTIIAINPKTFECTFNTSHVKYYSPEKKKFGISYQHKNENKYDFWSIGTIIYLLSFKEYPYNPYEHQNENINSITLTLRKTKDYDLDDLLNKLLEKDPNKRISWENYFEHPFFEKNKCLSKFVLGESI